MVTDALVFLRLWDVKMKKLTEKEKFEAGKAQMYQYLDSQYLAWHIVAVESIKKLILNLDDFYSDITGENQPLSIVEHEQIKNEVRIGWIFEALSHAEQAIEDLFSFLMLSKNIDTFVKNVVNYNATDVKRYIWNFKTNDPSKFLGEFFLPYFDLDNSLTWADHQDCYIEYRIAVLRMQTYLTDLVSFHKEHYQDYCQYKHGLAVGLRYGRYRNGETLTKGVLQTFDNRPIKIKNNTTPAALIFNLTPETQGCLRDLYNDSNMLHYSLHSLDIDEIIKVTGEAYELISVLRHNLIKRSRLSERDEFHEWAFPSGQREKMMLMGFPIEKD